jgi:hypothetical protein
MTLVHCIILVSHSSSSERCLGVFASVWNAQVLFNEVAMRNGKYALLRGMFQLEWFVVDLDQPIMDYVFHNRLFAQSTLYENGRRGSKVEATIDSLDRWYYNDDSFQNTKLDAAEVELYVCFGVVTPRATREPSYPRLMVVSHDLNKLKAAVDTIEIEDDVVRCDLHVRQLLSDNHESLVEATKSCEGVVEPYLSLPLAEVEDRIIEREVIQQVHIDAAQQPCAAAEVLRRSSRSRRQPARFDL